MGRQLQEADVRAFFARYEELFNKSLGGDANMDEVAALYASEFIAASPAGVMAGKNDAQLKQVMAQGYERYRAIGTRQMRFATSASPPSTTSTASPTWPGLQSIPAVIGPTAR